MAEKSWIEEMIEFEATPSDFREETVTQFCETRGIPRRTYYWEVCKTDIQKRIFELSLRVAKKETPEILHNLAQRAKESDRAAEIYLDHVQQLGKNLDIKTDGESISNISPEQAERILRRRAGIAKGSSAE